MTQEQKRIKLFQLNSSNRKIRSKMVRSLNLIRDGEYEKAERILNETRREFQAIINEKVDLVCREAEEFESGLGFTEVFHDSIKQASRLAQRNCRAVKFHVYN